MIQKAFDVNLILGIPIRKHRQRYDAGAPGAYTSLQPEGVGDCFAACIATIIGAHHIDDVPHFAYLRNIEEYHAGHQLPAHDITLARRWLRQHHEVDLAIVYRDRIADRDLYWIASVRSHGQPAGHAVVGHHDAIIFDPSSPDPNHCPYTTNDIPPDDITALVIAEPYDPCPDTLAHHWITTTHHEGCTP